MKKLILLPLALTFATNAAMAANSVDLRVTGTITPAACDISMSGGDFDLGTINANKETITSFTTSTKTLNILCSSDTLVGIKGIDNRADSTATANPNRSEYGLGFDNIQNKIGTYWVHLGGDSNEVNIGASTGTLIRSNDNGTSWVSNAANGLKNGPNDVHSWNNTTATDGPLSVTSVSIPLDLYVEIQPTNNLDTSQTITLDGSATIELVYL
ncbi:DUF1120 domain-containing protein [Pseudomonas sp. NPDC098747]|uniref:DUF1120 domain-containing protein n=1 Tax=Pseudomonas sp. NPDC098747 TaxID=3364487 RepID=UPI00383B6A4F